MNNNNKVIKPNILIFGEEKRDHCHFLIMAEVNYQRTPIEVLASLENEARSALRNFF